MSLRNNTKIGHKGMLSMSMLFMVSLILMFVVLVLLLIWFPNFIEDMANWVQSFFGPMVWS